ncbi:hypothetical protein Tco_0806558 [Tanacetum coccineum]
MLGFTEWLELHKLVFRKKGTANDQLLKNLKAKFKRDVVVDGMHMNLTPPLGITSAKFVQVIEKLEVEILYYNGNFDLVFQRKVYDELIWVIEARPDVVATR